jgi:hypothetical protein
MAGADGFEGDGAAYLDLLNAAGFGKRGFSYKGKTIPEYFER